MKTRTPEQVQRLAEVYRQRLSGMTFREIATFHGISQARARQLFTEEKYREQRRNANESLPDESRD